MEKSKQLPKSTMTVDEIKELDALLSVNDKIMPLNILHGFLTAVISAVDLVKPSEWLPAVLDFCPVDNGSELESEFVEALIPKLMSLYNAIASSLYDRVKFHPIIYNEDKESLFDEETASDELLSNWCWGYLEGVSFSNYPLDAFSDLLEPIEIFAEEYEVFAIPNSNQSEEAHKELGQKIRKDLPEIIQAIYDASFELGMSHKTTPPSSKVGRNALCPCGSGKKYKKCCLNKEQTYH